MKKPIFFATCTYGISFIILANSAANSVAFGQSVLEAAGATLDPGKVCAIAVSVNTFCCLLHCISRRWGIWLNNILGMVKMLMVFFFIIIGFIWMESSVTSANFNTSTSFSGDSIPTSPHRYAEALLFVMFPYSGFHQLNYVSYDHAPVDQMLSGTDTLTKVLAEIDQPQRKFKWAAGFGVLFISILYIVVNVVYVSVTLARTGSCR